MKAPPHFRFTVDEYDRMIEQDILTENDRVELIRGEIREKMAIGEPHAACVKKLNHRLTRLVGDRATIGVQDPIRLPDSEPEPDVSLVIPREDFYANSHPTPEEIFLVIEVADTSLEFDREVKLPMYAEAGIVECWIVNLQDQCIEVYRQPQMDGTYLKSRIARKGESIEILGANLAVGDVL